ncbi:hypothetical protein K435DRAFT_805713 [Dendrothele bispora CBS 962.96]|uniref:Uncharacterized protein n=1 Tax=Dendrothele bispora (strain CBS 962.96) TaxID=1314807 RepID=A0A4S8LA67_DENBC|nr:hypothetical protein K435DRAFT_805713 [Dendrothele bispora CBS 962.96]
MNGMGMRRDYNVGTRKLSSDQLGMFHFETKVTFEKKENDEEQNLHFRWEVCIMSRTPGCSSYTHLGFEDDFLVSVWHKLSRDLREVTILAGASMVPELSLKLAVLANLVPQTCWLFQLSEMTASHCTNVKI